MMPLGSLLEALAGRDEWPQRQAQARCLVDDTLVWLSYAQVAQRVAAQLPMLIRPGGGLAMMSVANDLNSVLALLAALAARVTVALIDPHLGDAALARLTSDFRPQWRYTPAEGWKDTGLSGGAITPDTALLLSTSGTTGTSRFVRLSRNAVLANARQIAAALHITPDDVAIAHLPLHYSYGLSVLLSHLERGAAALITGAGITSPELWDSIRIAGGTHFPGVPFHYTSLARLGIERIAPPCITTFTQAGGRLDAALGKKVYEQVSARGGKFYVMYGQTEAAPRMTTLDPARFAAKPDSVGSALEGGRVTIIDANGGVLAAGATGEIVYDGPNVMWGYASKRSDLALGDVVQGRLATGDRGRLDSDGDLFITGRNDRFAKIAGLRVALDELERFLKPGFEAVLLPAEESVRVFCDARQNADALRAALDALAEDYGIPKRSFVVRPLTEIPVLASGKIDFARLRGTT